ncbi:MAG: glycine cleavage system protein GcvH [Elusimicrobia bacterium]|nr:glycine cleavage system protein GcvH [Elusimicrobiota bacterium]
MNIPNELLYTKTHEWVKVEGKTAKVGITDYAQSEITDVVHVELPAVPKTVKVMTPIVVIESVKSAFDIYSPLSGQITKVNDKLKASPELVNQDPYGEGFLFEIEISDESELAALLKSQDYQNSI